MTKNFLKSVKIPIDGIELEGILTIPADAKGAIIFVHGSGSSRLSPRNTFVAEILNKAGFATLLFDLLTETEDEIYENRFNIPLLVKRIIAATNWLKNLPEIKSLHLGYFGASTGAAAAIIAASKLSNIYAVVSRGGRPDLAEQALKTIKSPTLLIVGGDDHSVIELNQHALGLINAEKQLSIVPHATHLFEEPGTIKEVAKLAAAWFEKYFNI